MIRTGFEKYVSTAGDAGNSAFRAIIWLFKTLYHEIRTYYYNNKI